MKKVLVTGATGFVGHHVVRELLKKDCRIIASSANEEKARQKDWFDRVAYVPFDIASINDSVDYYELFHRPDLVIHLAWEGLPNYKSLFHLQDNLPRHLQFLSNLVANGLTDLTVTGTCLEYGMQEGALREDMQPHPSNPYAIAKNELRKALGMLQQQHLFSLKWVRLFYMYGKGQNPNSLLSQLDKALANGDEVFNMSKGDQTRDYLPVESVAAYIVKIALQNKVTGIVNCCSGEPLSVIDLVRNYLQKNNKSISLNAGYYPYPDYEPLHFWGDNSKLKTILAND